jgi:ABC-type multidrug transport system fused ATPase/permease subunit
VLKRWSEDPDAQSNLTFWLRLYAIVIFSTALLSFGRTLTGLAATYQAAVHLFLDCLEKVIEAPTRYFDTVPAGRILNRLTSDIGVAE